MYANFQNRAERVLKKGSGIGNERVVLNATTECRPTRLSLWPSHPSLWVQVAPSFVQMEEGGLDKGGIAARASALPPARAGARPLARPPAHVGSGI